MRLSIVSQLKRDVGDICGAHLSCASVAAPKGESL